MNNMTLARVHSSMGRENNERLEFLGDAVLDLIVGEYLFTAFPGYSEGQLSKYRSMLVCESNLCTVGKRMGLDKRLIVSRSVTNKGPITCAMIADAVEAQIGAMHLTYGYDKAKQWVTENILTVR